MILGAQRCLIIIPADSPALLPGPILAALGDSTLGSEGTYILLWTLALWNLENYN